MKINPIPNGCTLNLEWRRMVTLLTDWEREWDSVKYTANKNWNAYTHCLLTNHGKSESGLELTQKRYETEVTSHECGERADLSVSCRAALGLLLFPFRCCSSSSSLSLSVSPTSPPGLMAVAATLHPSPHIPLISNLSTSCNHHRTQPLVQQQHQQPPSSHHCQ